MGIQFTRLDDASRALVERMVELKERRARSPGSSRPRPSRRPDGTPASTRAPARIVRPPEAAPPVVTPAPAQADLSAPHRVEQVSAGPARVNAGLPATPQPIARPSRAIIGIDLGTTNSCAAIVKKTAGRT